MRPPVHPSPLAQKPKPEPSLLQPLHDAVHGVTAQLDLLWKAGGGVGMAGWMGQQPRILDDV